MRHSGDHTWIPYFDICRKGVVERSISGAAAVITNKQTITLGDFNPSLFGRSIMKPFQQEGVASTLDPNLNWEQKAISVSSHVGTDKQQDVARSILSEDAWKFMAVPWTHPCSGKHVAILRACQLKGWPLESYLETSHPFHALYMQTLEKHLGRNPRSETVAPDGCKLPAIALPLQDLARLFLRLIEKRDADWIWSAFRRHPELIGGGTRLDTPLMKAADTMLAKEGADGMIAIAIATPDHPRGVIVKLGHGADVPVMHNVVAPILKRLGIEHPPAPEFTGQTIEFAPAFERFLDDI